MSRSRRVVLVMIEPPLPFGNAAGRWFYVLLRGLVERGHRVTAFAACSKPAEVAAARDLFPEERYDLRCYPVVPEGNLRSKINSLQRPHSYLFSQRMRRDLKAVLARGFDVLHLEQLWSAWLGLEHREKALVNVHYSFRIDLAGVPSQSLVEMTRRIRAEQAERRLLRAYAFIAAVSPRLAAAIRQVNQEASVFALPFGFDPTLYPFESNPAQCQPPTVGLIGSFHWTPTQSAGMRLLKRLWPAIQQRVPNARLQLVGRSARGVFQEFAGAEQVEIHEEVPDTRPYFQGMDAFLYAPHSGSGVKVKTLEAFALGAPVVTNADGVEGIPAVDGVHAGIAESDEDLIDRTVALLHDREQRWKQRLAARQLVERHCSPEATLPAVEAIYERIVQSKKRTLVA
jgi:glycosyltransferase involved in cell wall biosynthesis